ncbi:MAG: branched-chain amino acid ABC transporter permease [Microthrixaceae bacterium]
MKVAPWIVLFVILAILPFEFPSFRVEQFGSWMTLAIAACGLNLLTGYNGQISVGHGALFGIGAYTTGILITEFGVPLFVASAAAAVVCFFIGLLIGLPALRIKGLYLALVTLAVATLFPLLIEQFSSITGGSGGLQITSPQLYRGEMRERPIRLESPFAGLENDQWKYFLFLGVTVLVFVLSRNLIKSRVGRSLVAVRDNEVAAESSGIPISRVKILTFGLSAAIAGIGGSLFALDQGQLYPSSFTIVLSVYILVAVVVGGAASIIGPAIGAAFYGLFSDVLVQQMPDRIQPARAVILGVLLIVLMLLAPGGVAGGFRSLQTKWVARKQLS